MSGRADGRIYAQRICVTAGKPQVVACAHHEVCPHESVDPVGYNETVKAPLVAENLCKKFIARSCPMIAHSVERAHHARSAAFYRVFKRFEINFAHRLLVCPRRQIAAVGFLVVESEVFDHYKHALRLSARHDFRTDGAGEQGIFGIIFKVSARERRAMDIVAGRIPAVVAAHDALFAAPYAFFADTFAHFAGEFFIPCGRHDYGRRVEAGIAYPV